MKLNLEELDNKLDDAINQKIIDEKKAKDDDIANYNASIISSITFCVLGILAGIVIGFLIGVVIQNVANNSSDESNGGNPVSWVVFFITIICTGIIGAIRGFKKTRNI